MKGTCTLLCPLEELNMREREGLIHLLETETHVGPGKRLRADPRRTLKSYQRSAAGKEICRPETIRPVEVLLSAVHLLLNDAISDRRLSLAKKYDFIHDRLRAVRQDIIVQEPQPDLIIPILEPMVRFYSFCSYSLCDAPLDCFDTKLNLSHLLDCLKWLLNLYDSVDYKNESRVEIETLYLTLHLGSSVALRRSVTLPKDVRDEFLVKIEKISFLWYLGNYAGVCRRIQQLPPLLRALFYSSQLPDIRSYALRVIGSAYRSKALTYPLDDLRKLLLFDTVDQIMSYCLEAGLEVSGSCVHFETIKKDFKVKPEKCIDLEEKLSNLLLPELLLNPSG